MLICGDMMSNDYVRSFNLVGNAVGGQLKDNERILFLWWYENKMRLYGPEWFTDKENEMYDEYSLSADQQISRWGLR